MSNEELTDFGGNRKLTHGTVERVERGTGADEVEKPVYPVQNAVAWIVIIKTEILE
jgi:hypothetical protein